MKHITVLIIDEDPDVSVRLAHGLAKAAGFRVVAHTANSAWATQFAHLWKPKIIIADFKRGTRPRRNMIRCMKDNSPESEIIVYSSYYLGDERNEFLAAGATRCLLKGLTFNELTGEVRSVALADPMINAVSAKA
jgi:DNA-binding NarL/FixJ family response regulator